MLGVTLTIPLIDWQIPQETFVLGIITGLAYGLLAIGLTFAYRISRVINFAHGEIGALCAAIMPVLVIKEGWSYWPSLLAALGVAIGIGALIDLLVMRRLSHASRLVAMVATIGVGQVIFIAGNYLPREGLGFRDYPVPFSASARLGNLTLHTPQFMILVAVPVIVGILTFVLQRTYFGLAMRTSSENLEAAQLAGVPAARVSMVAWILVSLLAAVSAILAASQGRAGSAAPTATQSIGPALLAIGLGASMLGGLTSLPTVFAGGVGIGLAQAIIRWNSTAPGILELFVFLVILASLLLRKGLGQLARGEGESSWSLTGFLRPLPPAIARHPRVKTARRLFLGLVLILAVLAPEPLKVSQRVLLSSVVVFAIIGLSLVVLTGLAGQISLGQFAFVGLAALVAGRLNQLGYPLWVAVLYGLVAGALLALLIGLPALRVRGVFLAVVTLSFGVMASGYFPAQDWLVRDAGGTGALGTGTASSKVLPRPDLFGMSLQDERHFYWLCLGVLVIACAVVHRLKVTGVGRSIMAVRDNEAAAAALSINPRQAKLVAFAISGMLAALGGFLYASLIVNFTQPDPLLDPGQSLTLLVMVILGGVTTVSGAILGAAWIRGLPYFLGMRGGILASGIAVLLILLFRPGGLTSILYAARDRITALLVRDPHTGESTIDLNEMDDEALTAELTEVVAEPAQLPVATAARLHERVAPTDDDDRPIAVEDLVVRFGGVTAVDHVSMHARRGELLGLVGPNGAGKTTLFEVMSGAVTPSEGRVLFEGVDISDLAPYQRARLGLGRTFQQARLFPDLTLLDAVKVALECDERSELFPSLVGLPPSRVAERRKDQRAAEILELLGLAELAARPIAELSTGLRRLAEIACAVALSARVMLLDEPTAGLSQREVEAFVPMVQEIQASLDATMVVISHDVPMMVELVDRLYVLATGSVIAEGDPQLLRNDPRVLEAYMGASAEAPVRSPRRSRPLTASGRR